VADFKDVAMAGAELAINIGIIEAALEGDDRYPEEVRENFQDKVDACFEHMNQEILEFQQFGEAFDDSPED